MLLLTWSAAHADTPDSDTVPGPACTLTAAQLRLSPADGTLRCQEATVQAGRATVKARKLSLTTRGGGGLTAQEVEGSHCACPGERPWISFSASRARVAPGGRRLHLTWPTLRVAGAGILPLPYLALPLASGVSGLLPPEVGYGGRDGVRLFQSAYFAAPGDRLDLWIRAGWIQQHGAAGRLRLRAFDDGLALADVTLEGVADGEGARGTITGVVRARLGNHLWAGMAPDWISDRAYLKDLGARPERIFAPFLRSRIWAGGAWRALFGHATLDLLQRNGHLPNLPLRQAGSSPGGLAAATLAMAPVRLVGPLYVAAEGGFFHFWPGADPGPTPAAAASVLRFSPRLQAASSLLWFRLEGRVAYHLLGQRGQNVTADPAAEGWDLRQSVAEGWDLRQSVEAAAELSLPLARVFRRGGARGRHLIEPHVGLVWDHRLEAGAGDLLPDGAVLLRGGHLRAGARTRLDTRTVSRASGASGPRRRPLAGEVSLYWPLDPDQGEPLVGADLELNLRTMLRGHLRLLWAPRSASLPALDATACLTPLAGLTPCAGYTRLRLSGPMEAWGASPPGGINLSSGGAWLPLTTRADQVHASLKGAVGPFRGGLLVALDPVDTALSFAAGSLDLVLGCGCYRVGLDVTTRAGQRWPDFGARLTLFAPRAGPCPGLGGARQ